MIPPRRRTPSPAQHWLLPVWYPLDQAHIVPLSIACCLYDASSVTHTKPCSSLPVARITPPRPRITSPAQGCLLLGWYAMHSVSLICKYLSYEEVISCENIPKFCTIKFSRLVKAPFIQYWCYERLGTYLTQMSLLWIICVHWGQLVNSFTVH